MQAALSSSASDDIVSQISVDDAVEAEAKIYGMWQ